MHVVPGDDECTLQLQALEAYRAVNGNQWNARATSAIVANLSPNICKKNWSIIMILIDDHYGH
eukprot:1333147-Amorphochlora_amoeboformis.AAC.1